MLYEVHPTSASYQAGLMGLGDNPRRYMIERTDGEVEEGNAKREKKAK